MYRVKSTDVWFNYPCTVAAYQAIGAPDGVSARQNVASNFAQLGQYTATPGVAPTWNAQMGWTFNGSSQYLKTGIVPTDAMSMIVRLSSGTRAKNESVLGMAKSGGAFLIIPNNGPSVNVQYWHGNAATTFAEVAPQMLIGTLAISAKAAYRNGILDGTIPAGTGDYGAIDIYIGDYNNNGTPGAGYFFTGNVQSALIVSRTLTPAEVWQASYQMKYADQNPAWNAWGRRRRYFIPAAPTAGAVGIYGARATIALPGGVSIRATGGQT